MFCTGVDAVARFLFFQPRLRTWYVRPNDTAITARKTEGADYHQNDELDPVCCDEIDVMGLYGNPKMKPILLRSADIPSDDEFDSAE
jgi:hypothetical protein